MHGSWGSFVVAVPGSEATVVKHVPASVEHPDVLAVGELEGLGAYRALVSETADHLLGDLVPYVDCELPAVSMLRKLQHTVLLEATQVHQARLERASQVRKLVELEQAEDVERTGGEPADKLD